MRQTKGLINVCSDVCRELGRVKVISKYNKKIIRPEEKVKPITKDCRAAKNIIFASKCLLAGGLVYWTHKIGLWGDCSQTSSLVCKASRIFTKEDCFKSPAKPVFGPVVLKTQKTFQGLKCSTLKIIKSIFSFYAPTCKPDCPGKPDTSSKDH